MHNKIKYLFFILLVIFSCSAYSQTEEKSLHPKLDKYYPQKDNTPPPAATPEIVTPPVVAEKPVTETKPPVVSQPLQAKPIVSQIPKPEEKPVAENQPSAISAKPLVDTQSLAAAKDSNNLNKPVSAVVVQPAQKKTQIQPPAKPTSIYMDTRLGSSSPLYDTYEKNSNGAGSITSMPKR
jgi:hypothetical protein